jgi:hypothetical protein
VVLFVRHTANSLLIQLPGAGGKVDEALLANLQYALTRGVQEYFQVEESELGSDRVGQGAGQRILLWEAAEGGLGVLRRLVAEPDALARVARVALEILHFNPDTGEDRKPPESDDSCARACYDCLLSYYNQRDHRMLDRHTVKDLLMEMAHSTTTITPEREYEQEYRRLQALVDPNSQLETRLLDALYSQKRRLPDAAQQTLADVACRPDFFYENATCVFCDGSVHDEPQQKAEDETLRAQLRDKGYRVVVIRYDQDIVAQLDEHSDLFGEAVK